MPSNPAARGTDITAHSGMLLAGSPTVKVNERDAIRLSDPHMCPQTAPQPHVGGLVRFGTGAGLTVLINRKPATAVGGETQCPVGMPNVVITASPNVFYDITDTLAGLKVWQDAAGNIHIGDHITIKNVRDRNIHANGTTIPISDDDYAAHVLADVAKIANADPVGAQRLQSLDASGKNVTITPNTLNNKNARSIPLNPAAADAGPGTPGPGSDVNIEYTPEEFPPDPRAESTTTGAEGDVILFHEMNHADHQTHGRQASLTNDPALGDYHNQEEFNSIEPDENTYRRARGFPERHHHKHN